MRPIDADETKRKLANSEEVKFKYISDFNKLCAFIDSQPTVDSSPWHRVEDGLPEMSEIVPGYVCSEILALCDVESGHMEIGYVREKPHGNGVDWLWGEPFKNPTHWMPMQLPKEGQNDNNKM